VQSDVKSKWALFVLDARSAASPERTEEKTLFGVTLKVLGRDMSCNSYKN
jgi:hypothetical protein